MFRLTQGPVGGDAAEARFYAYLAMTAVTAAAAGLVVQVLGGPAGAGKALACAMVSAIVTGAGFLALNTGLGGGLTASFSWLFLRPALGLTLTLLTGAAFVGVLVGGLWRPARTAPTRTVALRGHRRVGTGVGGHARGARTRRAGAQFGVLRAGPARVPRRRRSSRSSTTTSATSRR